MAVLVYSHRVRFLTYLDLGHLHVVVHVDDLNGVLFHAGKIIVRPVADIKLIVHRHHLLGGLTRLDEAAMAHVLTGLIKHVFNCINNQNKNAICIYLDIFATQNLNDFVQALGTAIMENAVKHEKSLMAKAFDAFKAWRPVLSYDSLTGQPSVSISIEPSHEEHTLESIFKHLENLKKDVYIAIDEFQQIVNYPEKGIEALLRSHIQFSHAGFIFSGSRQHLMTEMFNSPKRPFYQSTEFINLKPLYIKVMWKSGVHVLMEITL